QGRTSQSLVAPFRCRFARRLFPQTALSLVCGYENSAFQAVWEAAFLPVRTSSSIADGVFRPSFFRRQLPTALYK
ncbi:MAG: hypothetical protein LBS16_05005, partial [Prevotellaceae bacterium]|nr:hypothetical protein [Prevotellaceae bacterium]